MKNAVFWDVMKYGFYKNRRFRVTYRLHHQGDNSRWAGNNVNSTCATEARCEEMYILWYTLYSIVDYSNSSSYC
jgi:hypothetical protein